MGRFESSWDSDQTEADYALWSANFRKSVASQKGQKVLRDLEAALLALPQPRLIEGSLCRDGEFCALGAYGYYQRLRKGDDAESARGWLEKLDAEYGDIAWVAREVADAMPITFTVAWEVSYYNDERVSVKRTPEERYEQVLGWVGNLLGKEREERHD